MQFINLFSPREALLGKDNIVNGVESFTITLQNQVMPKVKVYNRSTNGISEYERTQFRLVDILIGSDNRKAMISKS